MNDVTFGKMLASVMLDNKYDRFVKNRKTGKLDTRSLYKIETSSKLFKKREARKNKHYSVSLVVDCSGSMFGSKIKMAAECAEKLSKHLSKMGINNNIVVFNLGASELKPFNTRIYKDGEIRELVQSEVNDTRYYFFGQKDKTGKRTFIEEAKGHAAYCELGDEYSKKGISFETVRGTGYNSDAEALKFARERLSTQVGKKLMIFLSDGLPEPLGSSYESPLNKGKSQEDFDVKTEVQNTLNSNMELYSVGIMSDAVKRYYPEKRTCAINDIKQLYPHIIHLVKLNLKRG